MPLFIALYRSLNVGGNHPVKMEALRNLHQSLGHKAVQSYIQSGNILFSATGSPDSITKKLTAAFEKQFQFAAKLLLLTDQQLRTLIQNNPYPKPASENPKTLHAAICQSPPNAPAIEALHKKHATTESFTIKNNTLYLHAPDGFGTSKFAANLEKAANTPLTTRNWRTLLALAFLLDSST